MADKLLGSVLCNIKIVILKIFPYLCTSPVQETQAPTPKPSYETGMGWGWGRLSGMEANKQVTKRNNGNSCKSKQFSTLRILKWHKRDNWWQGIEPSCMLSGWLQRTKGYSGYNLKVIHCAQGLKCVQDKTERLFTMFSITVNFLRE